MNRIKKIIKMLYEHNEENKQYTILDKFIKVKLLEHLLALLGYVGLVIFAAFAIHFIGIIAAVTTLVFDNITTLNGFIAIEALRLVIGMVGCLICIILLIMFCHDMPAIVYGEKGVKIAKLLIVITILVVLQDPKFGDSVLLNVIKSMISDM